MHGIEFSPAQFLVEPAWNQAIKKMRVKRQSVRFGKRKIEMVIYDAAVTVYAFGRAFDICNTGNDQRNGTGRRYSIDDVVFCQRNLV